jgi:multidrug efflux pump subunit AcrB
MTNNKRTIFDKFEEILFNMLAISWKRIATIIITFIALALSVMMIPSELVLAKMLPGKNNNTFNIYVDLPSGSSIHQTKMVADCIIDEVKHESEVLDIELFLGLGSPLDFAGLIKGSQFKNNENVAEIVLNLTNKHERIEPSYLMAQRMRPDVIAKCGDIVPQTSIKFVEPPAGPPTLAAVVAEIYGDSVTGIRTLAKRVESVFKQTEGLVDIDIMQDEIYRQIKVVVDASKITRSGLDVKQVNDILYLALEGMGIAVKNSKYRDEQIPIFLTLQKSDKVFKSADKRDIELKLSSLKLMNKKGLMVPLTEVVAIVPVQSNPMIMTKDLHQMTNVVAETDMVSQVYPLLDAKKMILETFTDKYDVEETGLFDLILTEKETGEVYQLKWDGEMRVTIDTFIDLGGAFIAALVLIFLLMVVYYRSFSLSGIVLFGSFLSIIGVIVGHWIMDQFNGSDTFFLTATSLIGFIALIGISSRNALLLLDFTKSLMVEEHMDKRRAIAHAAATRAKPIFLTAVAIILASTLLASDAVFGGLGVSLIFGTVAAVLASLIVVPTLIYNIDIEQHFGLRKE